MRYVTIEEVVKINEDILGTEPAIIRDVGLLASAVDRPAQVVFGTERLPDLAWQGGGADGVDLPEPRIHAG